MSNEELLLESAKQLGINLEESQVDKFLLYMGELKFWNRKINLSGIEKDEDIITRHFTDSLTVCRYLARGDKILDIGTGGGFPGIPVAIVNDHVVIDMIDSRAKRIHFVKHIIRKLGLKNARAFARRVEDASNGIERGVYDVVVTRAFGNILKIVDDTVEYLKKGGRIVLMRGEKGRQEWENVRKKLDPSLNISDVAQIRIPFSDIRRYLIVLEKKR